MKYLTHQSILQCVHGGRVVFSTPAQEHFTINNSPALVEQDLSSANIVGCSQIGPGLKPCLKATTILLGRAVGIKLDHKIPLLITLHAMTDGTPPGIVCVMSDAGSTAQTLFPATPLPENRVDPAKEHQPDTQNKKAYIEIKLNRPDGSPAAGERYRVIFSDDTYVEGSLDAGGGARVAGIDPGKCDIIFPNLESAS